MLPSTFTRARNGLALKYDYSDTDSDDCLSNLIADSLPPLPPPSATTKIPRPWNQFMVFRSYYCRRHRDEGTEQTAISVKAAQVWKGMSPDDRAPYKQIADRRRKEHKLLYPDYKFSPGTKRTADGKAKKSKSHRREHSPYNPPPTRRRFVSRSPSLVPDSLSPAGSAELSPASTYSLSSPCLAPSLVLPADQFLAASANSPGDHFANDFIAPLDITYDSLDPNGPILVVNDPEYDNIVPNALQLGKYDHRFGCCDDFSWDTSSPFLWAPDALLEEYEVAASAAPIPPTRCENGPRNNSAEKALDPKSADDWDDVLFSSLLRRASDTGGLGFGTALLF
ncbi:hypothetical protein FISHEDRAFT_59609 [Fistulina hepatica ATCC 64428]|uniref:HMG box domain-containing protein n=1 Tax=Fistulina hepatica ATCC 64428 TaxID=1128425 RepID=A0A0D7A9Y5_9AGAR|nr:hypothetical protein FISHEDRAFT_59609 [Fistulina hepatica ATCC 64428]